MAIERCPTCKAMIFGWRIHRCAPRWEAINIDRQGIDDEPDVVYSAGYDEERVAEDYAAENFSNWDYPRDMNIWVRKNEDCEWKKFEVYVESVPSFTAVKLE